MSINMVISEKTLDAVVTHQFDSANDALNINNKLLAIKNTYEKTLLDENTSDVKRNAVTLKLQIIETSIKTLKPKINEPGTNL